MIEWLNIFGIIVFAIAGGIAAATKGLDLFGMLVVATVTAAGGGTLSDLILGLPVYWIGNPKPILLALLTAIAVFIISYFKDITDWPRKVLLVPDAIGLSVFTVIGNHKAYLVTNNALVVVMVGVMTAAFGGLLRDILCGKVPLILRHEIYATASVLGGVLFVTLHHFGFTYSFNLLIVVFVILIIRLAAIRWRLALPTVKT